MVNAIVLQNVEKQKESLTVKTIKLHCVTVFYGFSS